MSDAEILAKVVAVRQMAERFHLDFDRMLDEVLGRFPPDLVKLIRAKLETLAERAVRSRQ